MSAYAFVNYVRFKTQADAYTGTAYQNFSVNQTRTYSGVTYSFAPFAVSSGEGLAAVNAPMLPWLLVRMRSL